MMTVFLQTCQKIMTYFQTKMIKFKHDPLIIKDFVVQNIAFCPLEGHILYIYPFTYIHVYSLSNQFFFHSELERHESQN